MLSAVKPALPLELSSSGSFATRRRLAPSWPCRVLLLAVAVLRTVRHVLRIGQDVRTQHTPSTAAQTPPQFNPQRHAGVTTWSASRSASRSAGRRTFRGRSPTRGRGQGREGADDGGCPSAAARGGSGSHRVDEEDEPAPKRKKVMSRAARAWRRWVCGGRERTREWRCAFASLLAVCACAREAVIRSVRFSLFSVSMLLSSYES